MSEEAEAVVAQQDNGLTSSGKPKKYRASVVTKIIGDLAKESFAKSSYVVGFLTCATPVDYSPIREDLIAKVIGMPRFRSEYVWKRWGSYYKSIPEDDMDWDYHFPLAFEGEKPTMEEIYTYVQDKMQNAPLDQSKPLWQFHIIPENSEGKGVLVTNISHIIGDGISQIEVLYRLLDDDGALKATPTSRPKGKRKKKTVGTLRKASIFVGGIFEGVFSVFGRPDPPNSLKLKDTSKISLTKRQAFTEKIELARVKKIKEKVQGATINDVLMVLLTMVLKRYYEGNGEKVKKISASFPVNLRKSEKENFDKYGSPHNVWAYGIMNFSFKYNSTLELFKKLKRQLDVKKLSPTPIVQQKLGAIITPMLPLKGRNKLVLNLANKCTAQISNVAGPPTSVRVTGFEVEDLAFQLFSPIGLYLGLITYNGMLSCSINADADVADPEELCKQWIPAFEELEKDILSHEEMIVL